MKMGSESGVMQGLAPPWLNVHVGFSGVKYNQGEGAKTMTVFLNPRVSSVF